MSDMPYACSSSVPCKRCGKSGPPHWVLVCPWNPKVGLCLVCRFPEKHPEVSK